jgi:hypothetical protein
MPFTTNASIRILYKVHVYLYDVISLGCESHRILGTLTVLSFALPLPSSRV